VGQDLTVNAIATGRAAIETVAGDLIARFVDRDLVFEDIRAGGDGALTVVADVDVTGGVVETDRGDLTLTVNGALTQDAPSRISSGTGEVDVTVIGDLLANRIETGGACLALTVGGAIDALDPAVVVIVAVAAGALTQLRLGESVENTPLGLGIDVSRLDAEVARGDLDLREETDVEVVQLTALSGDLDLSARGDVTLGAVTAQGGTATITAGGACQFGTG